MRNFLITTVLTAHFTQPSCGQNAAWVQPAGGHYEEANHWVPAVVPSAMNDVIFNVSGDYHVGFLDDHTAKSLLIPGNIDLNFSSEGPGEIERTYLITGDANINNSSLTLGDESHGRTLHMEVGGKLNMRGGRFDLLNGAQLTSQTSSANSNNIEAAGGVDSTILVRGTDVTGRPSRWQSVGGTNIGSSGGPAGLAVLGGGQVSSAGTLSIGANINADGSSLEVRGTSTDGAPSNLTSGFFQVGFLAGGGGLSRATAQFTDGAYALTGGVQVHRDSTVIVDREDVNRNPTRWEAKGFQVFGGFVDVLGGGHITSDSLSLDRLAIARVEGVGASGRPSRWDINGNIRLGSSGGFGSLLIDSGVVTTDTAEIGVGTGDSLFSISGRDGAIGAWENSGDVLVGGSHSGPEASGNLRLDDEHTRVDIGGTLTVWTTGAVVLNGGAMKADAVDHTHGGAFDFNAGTLSVNTFSGDLTNAAGVFAPNLDSPGGSSIIGSYSQQSGGKLTLGIGGTGPGSTHDLVSISGGAQLDGLLELSLLDGFLPNPNDQFTVFAANSLFGFFDNITTGQRLDTSDGRGSFVVNYGIGSQFEETRIVLSDFEAASSTPGDFDLDGDVDAKDFLIWQRTDGSSAGLTAWQTNYGVNSNPIGALRSTNAIPEPTAFGLSGVVLLVLATNQRSGSKLLGGSSHQIQLTSS